MSEINPYAAPTSPLAPPPSDSGRFVPNGRVVAAGQGYHWLMDGFRLFFKVPVHFYISMVVHLVTVVVLALIPLIGGFLGQLALPMFTAGYFAIGHALKTTAIPDVSVMFTGFNKKPTQLLTVGVVAVAGNLGALLLGGAVGAGPILLGALRGKPVIPTAFEMQIVIGMLLYLALVMPLSMALWFAPALVVLHDVAPGEAMKQSFNACLKNFVPFLVYGLVAFVAIIAGAIPLLLGLFVVIPALGASVYPQYASIFAASDGDV
jgi:hypothetical protein